MAGTLLVRTGHPAFGWPLLLATIVLWRRAPQPEPAAGRPRAAEIALLAALTLAGGLARVVRLDPPLVPCPDAPAGPAVCSATVPLGCFDDEAEVGFSAQRIVDGDFFVYTPRNNGTGALAFLWIAPLMATLGAGIHAVRLAIAIAGTLTIPAVWFAARGLGPPRIALVAAALVAGSFWHLTMSRIGFEVALTPLCDAVAVGLACRAFRTGRPGLFLLTGGAVGVAIYGYAPSRLTPFLVAGVFAALAWSARPVDARLRRGLAVAALAAAALAIPLAAYAARHPGVFFHRARQVSIASEVRSSGSLLPVVRSASGTLRMIHERGDGNPRHNLPGRPQWNALTGIAILLGLGGALRARDGRARAVLVWLLYGLSIGIASTEAPHANRAVSALLPLALLAAWGFDALGASWRLAAAVALAVGIDTRAYFVDYPKTPGLREAFSVDAYLAGRVVRGLGDAEFVIDPAFNDGVVAFVSGRAVRTDGVVPPGAVRVVPATGPEAVVAVDPRAAGR